MSWAIREIAREQYKLMPNGVLRQDGNGVWSLDYIKGNFMGNAKAGTPTAYAYARIAPQEAGTLEPDFGFGPLPADAELVHCAGWADRRLIVLFHRGNPDISSSLMLAVGPQVPETWFAAPGAAPTPPPPDPAPPSPPPGDPTAILDAIAGVKRSAEATYDLVDRRGELLEREIAALPGGIPTGIAAAVFDVPPRENRTDLPEYVRFGTRLQEDIAYLFTRQDLWQAAFLAMREAAANLRAEGKI